MVMPEQVRRPSTTGFDPFVQVQRLDTENLGGFGVGVGILRLEEEATDVRGGFVHGMISCVYFCQ
jgi:hypothetical protein